jgi:16S rRNA (adenine1518-N6/adenine1519-N6)-dimethyltransferase
VELVRRPPPPVPDRERLFALVNSGFATRRKTLRNALAGVVTDAGFTAANIDPGARAETLSLDDWVRLATQ